MPEAKDRRFTSRVLLRAYLRIGFLISGIVLAVGLANLLTALFSVMFGLDFSYYTQQAVPMAASYPAPPVPYPVIPDERALDIVHGVATALVALLFAAVHGFGIRIAEKPEEREQSTLSQLTAVGGAIAFGLTAIIALVSGVSSLMSRILVAGSGDRPGAALATGLVFTVGWICFVVPVVRHLRSGDKTETVS